MQVLGSYDQVRRCCDAGHGCCDAGQMHGQIYETETLPGKFGALLGKIIDIG